MSSVFGVPLKSQYIVVKGCLILFLWLRRKPSINDYFDYNRNLKKVNSFQK